MHFRVALKQNLDQSKIDFEKCYLSFLYLATYGLTKQQLNEKLSKPLFSLSRKSEIKTLRFNVTLTVTFNRFALVEIQKFI